MTPLTFVVSLILMAQPQTVDNPILQGLLNHGIEANGVAVSLPAPTLADNQDAAASRAILQSVAGDERSVTNFVRDSVTAPFVLKLRDVTAGDATIRVADLWFVVQGRLDEIDLKQILSQAGESTVEAGNMRLTTKILSQDDLKARHLDPLPDLAGRNEWYSHATGRLLDRISVAATNHALATRTADSLTVASATSRAFDADPAYANRWSTLTRPGSTEPGEASQTYGGSGSYVKITNLAAASGCLFVEAHFAFVEPNVWFSGNPILRSKISLICQDQVRHLRREIQKRRTEK